MLRLYKPPRWIDWFYPSCTWRFVVSDNSVFLTFDDGPHPDITPFVLKELARAQMKATFFCVGENMKRYPELVKAILADGHLIGNHTMRHTKGTTVSNPEYMESINDFNDLYPTTLFRPPYGKTRRSQRTIIQQTHRIILWSWLSYDYDQRVTIQHILKKAQRIKQGEIIVLHDNPKITIRQKELLPALLRIIEEKNLVSKTIPTIS